MNDEQRAQPTEEDLRGALVLPGFELPEVFPLTRGQLFTVGLQPEDHSALAFLKLRDPRKPATKEGLAEEMRAIGWKMGKTRFDGIFGRLKAAGHIKHVSVFNPELGRPQWQIQFFANPSYNDEYVNSVIAASSQVGAGSLETGDPQTEQLFGTPETRISRGQKESQVSRDPEGNPWKPAFPSGDVPAGQGRNSGNPVFGTPPPHPPEEEVGTTSPSPHKHATASRRNKQPAPEVDAAAVTAAAKWLMKLPGNWAAGVQRAESLAPWLVRNAELTGWDIDMSLRVYLTRQDPGQKAPDNYGNVLGYRIKNMQPKEAVMAAAEEAAEPKQAEQQDTPGKPTSRMRDWCGKCNRGERPAETFMRVIPSDDPDDEKVTRCPDCHPAMTHRKHSNA
ncbi:hypothetical protein ABZ741_33985 [Streptomyces globisporus]|uniref:hypothetical protein n=1 Tax=Streptomyces globisporus TaxID=1908 RepID=UPI0034616794